MSNTAYETREYVKFSIDEFIAMIFTSIFASFAMTFDDWGDKTFDASSGMSSWSIMFMATLIILIITVWICKIVAIRLGYLIAYKAHYLGLFFGLAITVISNGYLPFFLPGGFTITQPERLRVGKIYGFYKGWHTGLIASTFPLAILAWIAVFNPLYLATQSQLFLKLTILVCLFAIYACIPVPFIQKSKSEKQHIFRMLNGCSFGLEVFLASSTWFAVLCVTILFFSALTVLLTILGVHIGFIIYFISLPLMMFCAWMYFEFFKH